MAAVELVDETFVVAEPALVAAVVHDPDRWGGWWPDLSLTPFMDRGLQGVRWSVAGRRWAGSIELWLEEVADGVVVHHYQRLDPVDAARPLTEVQAARERARRARAWKVHAFALKDALEADRRPGAGIHPDGSRSAP